MEHLDRGVKLNYVPKGVSALPSYAIGCDAHAWVLPMKAYAHNVGVITRPIVRNGSISPHITRYVRINKGGEVAWYMHKLEAGGKHEPNYNETMVQVFHT